MEHKQRKKFNTEEERIESIRQSKKRWADKNKEKIKEKYIKKRKIPYNVLLEFYEKNYVESNI